MGRMSPEEKRRWDNEWVAQRREHARAYLGGKCAWCGSTTDLEFDHIDSATKSFEIGRNLNRRWEVLVHELDKCQLLCHDCHRQKTIECGETGGGWNKNLKGEIPHGTVSGYTYWKCRCPACKQARYEYRCGGRTVPRRAKLDEDSVRAIRTSRLPGVILATTYGVHPTTISSIRLGKTWRHVA